MELVGLIGFGIATLAYCVFFLLLVATKPKSFTSKLLLIAVSGVFFTSLCSALQLYIGFSLFNVLMLESVKLLLLTALIFSINYNLTSLKEYFSNFQVRRFLIAWIIGILVSAYSIFYLQYYSIFFMTLLALNLYPLVLLEQVYRNATEKFRWSLWPLVVAIGSLVVFDFILYAQAALINHIDFSFWFARGYIAAFVVPFFLLSSKRIKNLSTDIFVSRDVVFYSSMLAIAGLYLLLLAFAGYVIRYLEGEWSHFLSIIFLAIGLLVLIILFITNSFRRKLMVFISKHFFANKYEYRDEWLKVTSAIEKIDETNVYESLCEIMASSLGVHECAYIKCDHQEPLEIRSKSGLHIENEHLYQLALISDFCQQNHWIIDMRDFKQLINSHPELIIDEHVLLQANLDVIVPVYKFDNLIGLFVLPSPKEKPVINWEDRDYLFAVSKQLANYLFLHQAQKELFESKQFTTFNRMSAFVLHDLKNIQAQLSLITTNALQHRNNPDFIDDVFDTVKAADDRLDKVISQLRNKGNEIKVVQAEMVDVFALLTEIKIVRDLQQPSISISCDDGVEVFTDKDALKGVLIHLIQNAQDSCNEYGEVQVNAHYQKEASLDGNVEIQIIDNGCGMNEHFIQNDLFKPFVTTKGNAGMGIGAYEAKQFIREQHGKLTVNSELLKGTTFSISLPIRQPG